MSFPNQKIQYKDLPLTPKVNQIYEAPKNKATYINRVTYILKKDIKIGLINNKTTIKINNKNKRLLTNCTLLYKLKKDDLITIQLTENAYSKLIWLEEGYWAPYDSKIKERIIQESTYKVDHLLENRKLGSIFFYSEITVTKL